MNEMLAAIRDWWRWLSPSDLTIRHRPGRPLEVRGRLPRSKLSGIATFFARDLRPEGRVTVLGTRANGSWRWRILGNLSQRDGQRVRNFLTEHLR